MRKMINQTAGIIVAAGKREDRGMVSPLFEIGSISIIKRIVLTFQQANISPIVVVTGYQSLEVEQHLSDYGVIFLKNENFDCTDKLASAKIGLEFIQDKCQQVFFTSISIPMYSSSTLQQLMRADGWVVAPSYHGKSGHPLLINQRLIKDILAYEGSGGMRHALQIIGAEKTYVSVEDQGIILEADDIERLDGLWQYHNDKLIHPFLRLSIEKESLFFNSRAKLLLMLIQETHSVKSACKHMALSYGKAWNMINEMEEALGYEVLVRKHGGSRGGQSLLTREGEIFLEKYQKYEDDVRRYAIQHFGEIFTEFGKMN